MRGAVAVVLWLGACGFSARLDDRPPADGTSVPNGDAAIDAPVDAPAQPPDAPAEVMCALSDCVTRGGVCQLDNSCLIDTSATSVTCPTGVKCTVVCDGDNACKDAVNCGMATSCHVTCRANNACELGVQCGSTPCEVICDGRNTDHSNVCKGMIRSTAPASCTVHCCGTASSLCESGASQHCTTDTICMP